METKAAAGATATIGVGDTACDLIPARNLLPASARQTFR